MVGCLSLGNRLGNRLGNNREAGDGSDDKTHGAALPTQKIRGQQHCTSLFPAGARQAGAAARAGLQAPPDDARVRPLPHQQSIGGLRRDARLLRGGIAGGFAARVLDERGDDDAEPAV